MLIAHHRPLRPTHITIAHRCPLFSFFDLVSLHVQPSLDHPNRRPLTPHLNISLDVCNPTPSSFHLSNFFPQSSVISIHLLPLTFLISYSQLVPCHYHDIHPRLAFLQPCSQPGSVPPILGQSNFFLFYMFCRAYFFCPQQTTPPEIPVANPTVPINHTPVRGAFNSLGTIGTVQL